MKGFVDNFGTLATKNADFRRLLYTAPHCQLVLMTLKPKEEIGAEVHTLERFFRMEEEPQSRMERPSRIDPPYTPM